MFIYVLNFLNDGLKKKNNIYERSDFQVIKDTIYILQLADVKKSLDFKSINNKIIDIFKILDKYNLTTKDSLGILNKLIINNNNSWVLERLYNNKEAELELMLSSVINNMGEKFKRGDKT